MNKPATSLRPHIVPVMAAHQGLILTTEEIYQLVAELRTHNIGRGVMVDAQQAELTGRRLVRYHREIGDETL